MRFEFSKAKLAVDYLILVVLLLCNIIYQTDTLTTLTCAWIVEVGATSGFYYWKSKNDNKMKIPVNVVKSLPKQMREQVDLTQIIVAIIQSETN